MKTRFYLLIVVLSAIILSIGWQPFLFAPLLFIAFIPLFFVLDKSINSWQYFLYAYTFLFLVNTFITAWLYQIHWLNGISVHTINSILFLLPFLVVRLLHLHFSTLLGCFMFCLTWILVEQLHFEWELHYPYLTLGFGLADFPFTIQFYEYTGVLGGSFWILFSNCLLYRVIIQFRKKLLLSYFLFLFTPLLVSFYLYLNYTITSSSTIRVLLVHTDLNNATEKYNLSMSEIAKKYLDVIKPHLHDSVHYVLLPESAIPNAGNIERLGSNGLYNVLDPIFFKYSHLRIISGAIFSDYDLKKEVIYYNAAAEFSQEEQEKKVQIRGKDKMVPIDEGLPYPFIFRKIQAMWPVVNKTIFNKLSGSEGFVFYSNQANVATLICYETLFSHFATKFTNNNADIFFVILNEGWHNNSIVAKEFYRASVCLAIEHRKYVVRSSNKGLSGAISPLGDSDVIILGETQSKVINTFKQSRLTFFVQHPYAFLTVILFFYVLGFIYYFLRKN